MRDERNTYPCRGCGKPYLEDTARKIHESSCPQVNTDDLGDDRTEAASQESVKDQDQQFITPPEPDPEPDLPASNLGEEPEKPDRKAIDFGSGTCQCCGADVGNTTRKGLCFGCDLAGCRPSTSRCSHRSGDHV